MGKDTVWGLMFADDFVGSQKHPKDCRNRESTRVQQEMESDSEREKMRSSCMQRR